MNIVHFLSFPRDMHPLFIHPVSLECLELDGPSLLTRKRQDLRNCMPGAQEMVIDPSPVSFFYTMSREDDILSLPDANLVQSLFIHAAFTLATDWDPVSLFLPGHYDWLDYEALCSQIRHLQKDDFASGATIQFAHTEASSREKLFIPGDTIYDQPHLRLIKADKDLSWYELKDIREKDPDFAAYSRLPMLWYNALELQKEVQNWSQDYQDLFYLLMDAFRDGSATSSLLSEVIKKMREWYLNDLNRLIPDTMYLPLSLEYKAFYDLSGFMRQLPLDEEQNFVKGNVHLEDCSGCMALNYSKQNLTIEKQSNKLIIFGESQAHITNL